jgi:hypothetical protein
MKLTQIMNENQENRPLSNEVKKHFLEIVSTYNKYQEMMDRKSDLATVAETLGGITEAARTLAIHEGDDWFDKHTIKRNMSELDKLGKEFDKCAKEATSLDQRLGGLYEDMGHILSRYYKIGEITEDQMKQRLGIRESKELSINEDAPSEIFADSLLKQIGPFIRKSKFKVNGYSMFETSKEYVISSKPKGIEIHVSKKLDSILESKDGGCGCGCGGTTESTCGCGTHTHESVNEGTKPKFKVGDMVKYKGAKISAKVLKVMPTNWENGYLIQFQDTKKKEEAGESSLVSESVNEESINEAKIYKVIFAGMKEKDAKDFFTMVDGSPKIKAMTRDSGVFKVGNEVTIRFGVGSKQELELIKKVAKLERLKIVKIDESVNESASKEAMGIAGFTGTRGSAVEDFITKNELNGKKLFQYVKKGGLKQRMEFVSAIAGNPGNKIQKMIISKFKLGESVNEEEELTKFGESVEKLMEKNVPTDAGKWSYYKSQAKKKFDVYPSAYANGWAAKQYKAAGGGWKKGKSESVNETELKLGVKYVNKQGKEGFIQTGGSKNPKNWVWFDGKTKHPYDKVKKELKPSKDQKKSGFGDYLKQGGRVWDNVNPTNSPSVNEAKFGYKDSTASYINNHKDEYKQAEKLNKGNEVKFYDALSQMEEKIGHPKFMIFLSNALRGYKVDMYKDPKIKNPQDAQEALFLLSK